MTDCTRLDADALAATRATRFEALIRVVLASNPFYQSKYRALGLSVEHPPTLTDMSDLLYTEKAELVRDQLDHPPFGTNLSFPIDRYTRIHQTSGTTGEPLRWLDTAESWQWWLDCWKEIYQAAGVTPDDRVLVAFSFGPFIGFWTAFDACQQLGAMAIPGGGLSSKQRIEMILDNDATVLVCTPTYALRLAEIARQEGQSVAGSGVRVTIHAGEPGASIPNVKKRIETEWGARCVDHAGATEVGAWGYSCGTGDHMHINEAEFIAEVIDSESRSLLSADPGGAYGGELVLTNLGRAGSPVIRYRTGDLVELVRDPCSCGRETAYLRGGVLGRVDGMLVVRGINVFPGALEGIVREFASILEFEVSILEERGMSELVLRVEVGGDDAELTAGRLRDRIHSQLNLRPRVEVVDVGTLPRYELKARRFKVRSGKR